LAGTGIEQTTNATFTRCHVYRESDALLVVMGALMHHDFPGRVLHKSGATFKDIRRKPS